MPLKFDPITELISQCHSVFIYKFPVFFFRVQERNVMQFIMCGIAILLTFSYELTSVFCIYTKRARKKADQHLQCCGLVIIYLFMAEGRKILKLFTFAATNAGFSKRKLSKKHLL